MTAAILRFPPMVGARLEACTEWLLAELDGPADIATMRALAARELRRPRDPIHRVWAEEFLRETEQYV
jgi:hypothetical protein